MSVSASPHTPSSQAGRRTPAAGSPAVGMNGTAHRTPAGHTTAGATPRPPAGRLERMLLSNFKSYDGLHSVPFVHFTAVIGPNGSGKSNLLDALSFVLGLRLEKDKSRASVLTDLLHKKQDETLADIEAAGKGREIAWVQLVYIGADGTENNFRRSVNSKGVSTYSVDDRKQSAGQYKAALESVGIWVEAKNFLVFQGDVESIAHKTPKELAELIDLLSGGSALKSAYDEAKAHAESKEEEFTKSFEHKRYLTKERNQMKQQKEEAEQYNLILEQYKASKVNLTLFQLFHLQNEIDKKKKEAKEQKKDFDAKNAALEAILTLVKTLQSDTARLRKEQAVLDKQLAKSTAALDKKRPAQIALKQELLHLAKTRDKEKNKLEAAVEAQHANAAEQKKLEKELKKVQSQLDDLNAALEAEDEKAKELQLAAAQLQEYNELKQRSAVESAEITAQIKTAQHDLRVTQESLDTQRSVEASIVERADVIRKNQEEVQQRQSKNQELVSKTKEELAQFKKELAALKEKSSGIKSDARKIELETELRVVDDRLMEAKSERRARESDLKLHETVGTLQTHFSGVRGVLSELSSVMNPKWSVAVATALGRHLDSVVVDEERTALECISYLKEQRLPPVTFIPLNTIKVKQTTESLRQLKANHFLLAIDCVSFEETLERAFLYALGDTLICVSEQGDDDAIKRSRKLSSGDKAKHKVITLAGTVIHKSGNLTGGTSTRGDGSSKLRAAGGHSASKTQISEKEFAKIKDKREELIKQLVEVEGDLKNLFRQQDEEAQLLNKITSHENRLRYAVADLEAGAKKSGDNEKKLKLMSDELARLRPKIDEIEADIAAKSEALGSLESELSKREEKLFRDFSRKVGVSNIREFESERLKLAQQYAAEKAQLQSEFNNLKNQLDYERTRDLQKPIEQAKAKIADINAEEKKKKEAMAAADAESEKEQAKTADMLKEAEKLNKDMEAKQSQLKSTKKQVSDLELSVMSLDKSISMLRSQVTTLMLSRHELLRQARVDDIELPKLDGPVVEKSQRKKKAARRGAAAAGEDEEEEEEKEAIEEDMADVAADTESAELLLESRIRFDYSDLDDSYLVPDSSAADRERWRGEFLKVLAAHQEALDTLAPNLKSIEKFGEVSDKFNATRADWDEKKKAVKQASDAFEHIKDQRFKMFMTAYEHLTKAVGATYTQLTASRDNPAGGNAYLSVESNEEPYLHGVKYTVLPPAKRFREMKELSGGEKTVAALAMLFAMHSFRPAPFFVLDEIDAALDNINVTRVANYIRARSHRDGLQVVVISLKDSFYNKADAIVGVYKDQAKTSSAHLTIDLTKYQA